MCFRARLSRPAFVVEQGRGLGRLVRPSSSGLSRSVWLAPFSKRRLQTYREINEGPHGAGIGGYGQLVASTRALVKRVREQA